MEAYELNGIMSNNVIKLDEPLNFSEEKRVKVIILMEEKAISEKTTDFKLTSYKCMGKLKDFTREDAYETKI